MDGVAQQEDYSLLYAAAARLENNYTPDTNFLFEDSLFSAKGTNKENRSWQNKTEWFYEEKKHNKTKGICN